VLSNRDFETKIPTFQTVHSYENDIAWSQVSQASRIFFLNQ
jgi:hypothetical protein